MNEGKRHGNSTDYTRFIVTLDGAGNRRALSEDRCIEILDDAGCAGKERDHSAGTCPDVVRCAQMTGHGAKFGRKNEEAIAALLTQRNVELSLS